MNRKGPRSGLLGLVGLICLLAGACERVEIGVMPASHASPGPDHAPHSEPAFEAPRAPEWSAAATGSALEPGSARDTGTVYTLPGMECLVNNHGIRVKVLITEPGVRCLDRAPGGVLVGNPLKHFHPYFVFDRWPVDGPAEYYLLGPTPRRDATIGWAPAAAVARWDTRVGVRYARREGVRVPPLLVYGDKDSLLEQLTLGSTDDEPLARASLTGERTLMPWPVAESELVTVDGVVHELVRIDFLAELVEGSDLGTDPVEEIEAEDVYTEREVESFRKNVRMLDVVFCVDNTHSTGEFIDAIHEAVRHISQELDSMPFQPDVNFGLVLFRDYVDGVMFVESGGHSVVRNYGLDGDLSSFLRRVAPLREAEESSIDWAEAGYDGLDAALNRTAWRGSLAEKVVVLISDNSFHEPDSDKNPRGIGLSDISRAARDLGVQVFPLAIEGKGGVEEQELHWAQSEAIALATGGACYRLDEAQRVVDQVRGIMDDQTQIVATHAVVLDDLIGGSDAERIAADHQLDIRQVTEVMEFLGGAGIDVEKLGPGVPSFATGWVLCEVGGVQIVDREVYVARLELDVLLAAMNLLCSNLSADFGRQAFGMGMQGRVDPLSSFFQGEVPEPLDVYLMAKGIPVGKSSILRRSSSDVRHMPEETRAQLRERIARNAVPSLVNVRNDDAIWTFRDDLEFGWIREDTLP